MAGSEAVVIETSGEFSRLGKPSDIYPWENLSNEDILKSIKDMGIVGLGRSYIPHPCKSVFT